MTTMHLRLAALVCLVGAIAAGRVRAQEPPARPQTVRCAVIGGLTQTNLWNDLADRFERASSHQVELVASGPKHVVADAIVEGKADLATMHASDAIVNLVADGYAADLQPWLRSDMILVGPASDPAGIRGEQDAVRALEKIIATKSRFLIHASAGASEVLHDLLAAGSLTLDPERTLSLPSDKHRQMLRRAEADGAYTLVGRIPFLNGKLEQGGLEIMVQGDARLRRPYLVVVARDGTGSSGEDSERRAAARELAAFLCSQETQRWIAEYGRGQLDDQPLFFPVEPRMAASPR
jgi:tungstate transport system substrate-binding protein